MSVISILLPVYNAESTLATALRSIERQSEKRWDCVIVDDGSDDRSAELAASIARADSRFRLIRSEHRGIVAALNLGLEHCEAPLVARMDADDWMHRSRLEAQIELLDRDPHLAAAGCHVRIFPRANLQPGRRAYERWLNGIVSPESVRADAFVECPIAHPTLVMRKHILAEHRYRDCGWPEDYDLLLRLLASDLRIGLVPQRLLGWRDSPHRLSRTGAAYALSRFTACKAAHLATGFLAGSENYILWGYGETGRALRRALLEHERSPSHIVEVHPRRIGQRIHGAPVIEPAELAQLHGHRIVASVAGASPRAQIRAALTEMSFVEGRDFVCAA
jgi:hypothetical protein